MTIIEVMTYNFMLILVYSVDIVLKGSFLVKLIILFIQSKNLLRHYTHKKDEIKQTKMTLQCTVHYVGLWSGYRNIQN